jgi:3-hydroxyisobutyrate dehydrogenase-like beta-hydroxyacid dehydrogenase
LTSAHPELIFSLKEHEEGEPLDGPPSMEKVMASLGFVGLGEMGGRIAKRLLAAGHEVTGYNRTRSKAEALLAAGMRWGESPLQTAQAADVVFSMVTNTTALREVTEGQSGILAGLAKGKIYIDMSTVSPAASRAIALKAAAAGAVMLDAPVSGSISTLEEGKLSIMVGGDPAAFEKVKPILLDIGPKVTRVGANGLAVTMKIAVNLSLAVQMLAFSEGVLLAEKSGIKRETAVEVLTGSAVASPMVKYRGPFVLNMPPKAWFDVNMMQKDMNLALELGRQLGVPLPTTAAANELLTAARGMGLSDKDFAVVFEVLARLSGAWK